MAGSKHERSGGSEGTGEVSPLTAQLQQAWLQTQMPKLQKRTFMSGSSAPRQPSRLSPSSGPIAEQSALRSLSSIFPELANIPEEKKPTISSVFKDGEEPGPLPDVLQNRKKDCLGIMFVDYSILEKEARHKDPQTKRSISASHVQRSSGSSDFSDSGHLSSSHSFSGSTQRAESHTPFEDLIYPTRSGSQDTYDAPNEFQELDPESAAKVEGETRPLFSYLSDMLMDENVEDRKCMFVEMSAYQAMAKELGDLIGDDSPPSPAVIQDSFPEFQNDDDTGLVDNWINEILNGPPPTELRDGHYTGNGNGFADKNGNDYGELSPQTDSDFCSSTAWEDGRDADSEGAECRQWVEETSPSGPSENTLDVRSNEKGYANNAVLKSVVPAIANGVHVPSVDLTNLLISCAQAVEQSDYRHANELIGELHQHSSAYGNAQQRMAHYFTEALLLWVYVIHKAYLTFRIDPHTFHLSYGPSQVARMSGTGGQLYTALSNSRPSAKKMLEAFRLYCNYCPFIQVSNYFANHTILDAFKDAPRVHVVDYGILYGTQWPCLIHQLSERKGGPPHLRITGIDRPQPGFRPSGRIQETGRRLAELAKMKGVPFEFHAIAEKWEAITPAHLMLREDEVLAVNCMYRLHHILDEQVTAASPRTLVLNRIRRINPKVFVQGVINAGYNAPFFMSRFREALATFSTLFEYMDESMPSDNPLRILIDQEIVGRDILNVVACEGLERVERPEPYRQWQSRTTRAGFQQMPITAEFQDIVKKLMTQFHPKYGIGEDGNWFLLGWKEHITHAMTAWEPASVSP